MSESVVVTGIGLVSPAGTSAEDVFSAVCDGRSGLTAPPEAHPLHGVVDVAGFSPAIDPASVMPAKDARVVDRSIVMALRAATDAVAEAGLEVGTDVDPFRVAAVVSGVGGLETMADQSVRRSERGRLGVSPYLLSSVLPNMPAARIAMKFGIRGFTSSVGTACASGGQSIGEALRILRADEADVVVCGATEAPLFPTFADAFGNAFALARSWPDPTTASRPFDRRRNGLVLAEGAGVLVLERAEFARARGATPRATVLGWAATSDAFHPMTPRPDGSSAAQSMRLACRNAGLSTADIGYLNAHGTSTKAGDAAEAKAVRSVYETDMPPVSSTKGITGHLLGASGIVEAAISIMALRGGLLPPTHNLDDPDPACDLDHVRKEPLSATVDAVMSNSFGFGGHNVSVIFGR